MYGCREYVQYNVDSTLYCTYYIVEYNCTQSYVWTPIYILLLRWALRITDTRLPLLYIPHFMIQSCELKYFVSNTSFSPKLREWTLCCQLFVLIMNSYVCDVDIKVGIF